MQKSTLLIAEASARSVPDPFHSPMALVPSVRQGRKWRLREGLPRVLDPARTKKNPPGSKLIDSFRSPYKGRKGGGAAGPGTQAPSCSLVREQWGTATSLSLVDPGSVSGVPQVPQ